MALSELEIKRCEKLLSAYIQGTRPPPHLRERVDVAYRLEGQTVDIFEIRPTFRDESVKREAPVAKARFVATQGLWKIFWMRADLKWHSYEPDMHVKSIEDFIRVVEKDEHGCFWG